MAASPPPRGRGFTGLWKSFGFAFQGIAWTARTERNWRIHAAATLLVTCLAAFFRVSAQEVATLAITVTLVLALETMNTAIEATIDVMAQPPSELARRAKDAAAGSVLLGAIGSLVVAAAIFGPRIFSPR